ncbi:hypothetical protein ABZP36_006074 [Zizania latifolia]
MGIAAPPSQPGQTTTFVSQPKSCAEISSGRRPATASSMSHSQGFHQGSSGVFGFSSDGFDRPAGSGQDDQQQQQHVAQQSRRDKLRVQGFDLAAAAAEAGHGLLPIEGDEHAEPSAMYEHAAAAAAGASNMLSEMFNFPSQPPTGPSATELLASQMNANYRFGFRQAPGGVVGLAGDGGWFGGGAAGRTGLVLGGATLGSLGETSSLKQQGSMPGLATDPTAAMHLFLMNPQQQQQSRSSPTSPPPSDAQSAIQHHEAFQAFGSGDAPFGGGAAGVMEGQGLSLSLSPSLQQLEMAKQADELRVRDGVLYFNRQQQQQAASVQQLPMALHGQVGALGQQLHVGYGPAGVAGVLRNSKYTRAAQELLEEFCSVGRGQIKSGGAGRGGRGSAPNPNASKGGGATSSGAAQSPSSASKEPPQLSPAERFEHQRKKAKLISMLDEVDRRYNHYCDQMQMVVNFFDSVMGFGAATPYTALAQKAMSRHFRCLKDAIVGQLRHTCELLGEKDAGTSSGLTKGETPKLRAIDQSLRQQRAFHHMGMMEQEAWRPQRGLPERSVNILRSWLFEHFLHPYPSDADKHLLARQTGLSRNQVSNWFINARVRLWKPMIEEMYQQECKELEGSSAAGGGGGPESGNDHSGADDTHSPTTTGAQLSQQQASMQQQHMHQLEHGASSSVMPHKHEPGVVAGPSAADAAFVGLDPVELLGGVDAHVGAGADDLYGRFEPGVRVRYGPTTTGAAAGDVSLTLGLQHAGAGNAGPDGSGRFSLRDYSGC